MMKREPIEREVAGLTLGLLPENKAADTQARMRNDPSAEKISSQMQETVQALKEWRESLKRMPCPVLAVARPVWLWPAGIAAAVFVGVCFAISVLFREAPDPDLSLDLAWTKNAASLREPAGMWELSIKYRPDKDTEWRDATVDGKRTYQPRKLMYKRDMQKFTGQFAFSFNVPETVAGGLELQYARPAGSNRVSLLYAKHDKKLPVYLSKSAGPDTELMKLKMGNRPMIATRRNGIVTACEATFAGEQDWPTILAQFTKNATKETNHAKKTES